MARDAMLRVGLTLLLLAGADGDGSPEYQAQQDVARLGLPEQAADWTPAEVRLISLDSHVLPPSPATPSTATARRTP